MGWKGCAECETERHNEASRWQLPPDRQLPLERTIIAARLSPPMPARQPFGLPGQHPPIFPPLAVVSPDLVSLL